MGCFVRRNVAEVEEKKPKKHQVFAALAAITVAGALAGAPPTVEPEKVDMPGIENFSRINGPPGFAGSPVGFGGATQSSAMSVLRRKGFATVINLRLATEEGVDVDSNRAAAQSVGLNYIHLPFESANPNSNVVDDFLAAVGDKANQPVYIHCNSATRVAVLWMIGRVLQDGLEIDAAGEEVEVIADKPSDAVAFATMYIKSHGK